MINESILTDSSLVTVSMGQIRYLERKIQEEREKAESYRKALRFYIYNCPICGGTGTTPGEKQAWDIPEASDPECSFCAEARYALEK